MEETITNRQSLSAAKPKTAVTTRRIGVNIRMTRPTNIKVTGSNVPENMHFTKLLSEGFVESCAIDDGEIAAINNPTIIKHALIHTPIRSTRLVHRSAA